VGYCWDDFSMDDNEIFDIASLSLNEPELEVVFLMKINIYKAQTL